MLYVVKGDLPIEAVNKARDIGIVGCDIETTGLDPKTCEPKLFQMRVMEDDYVVRLDAGYPHNITDLLLNMRISKIFHYAMFDLGFLRYHYGIQTSNVICTKTAVKILDPDHNRKHSLKDLVSFYFGVTLNKTLATSNWDELTPEQLAYVQDDVRYLEKLWTQLKGELQVAGKLDVAERAFRVLPLAVEIKHADLPEGVFSY